MSYVFWDLFGLFLVVFHKSLRISFIKQRRRKILLANLYMEANILHWPSTACAITTVHKLHCLPTLTKKHQPYEAEHQIKLTGIRNPDKKAFVSAMQKSCWCFWLHYHIQRTAMSLHSFRRLSISLQSSEYCIPTALLDSFLENWRKIRFGNCKEYWTFFFPTIHV